MNTQDIMQTALALSGMHTVPPDTALFVPADNIARLLFGIDICEDDLQRAAADQCDLVISHHPLRAFGALEMMVRHEELMLQAGVPTALAREACRSNMEQYRQRAAARPPDNRPQRLSAIARELGIGLMNIHAPCDELGRRELQRLADELVDTDPVTALIERYRAVPDIAAAGEKVELVCGSESASLGRVVVMHGAGTNGGYDVATALFDSGIDTVVYIHLHAGDHRERLVQESKGNLLLTGHYGSDSLGINPFLDLLEDHGIEVSCCGNMVRITR